MHSRGEKVEDEAFFFLDELEAVIRDWITTVYHRRRHRGLCVPEVPGLKLSPLEMFEHGVTRAARCGFRCVPTSPWTSSKSSASRSTTTAWTSTACATTAWGSTATATSPALTGAWTRGKWPIAIDSGDITKAYFQDPQTREWHVLHWEHAAALGMPVSREALAYARRLAKQKDRFPDTKRALVELLERWGAGLTRDRTERRMAVRLSQERLRMVGDDEAPDAPDVVASLPALRKVAAAGGPGAGAEETQGPDLRVVDGAEEVPGGDDDEDDELAASFPGEESGAAIDEDDYYADVWESR